MCLPLPLILASASPRRKELLSQMGVPFEVIVAKTEEVSAGDPQELVKKNAFLKAAAVQKLHPERMILGSDTVVYANGQVLGKPRDGQDAFRMLKSLSGRKHLVYTGVCLLSPGYQDVQCDETAVYFSALSDAEIHRYIASGEPMDKAGAYAIQGRAGMYVEKICGSFSNVIGLPMALVRRMLETAERKNT